MRERRVNQRHRSVGTTLLVIFFAAGALICLVTMLALAFPGGFLEPIWRLKPEARVEFQQIGNWSVALMAMVGAACGLAGLAKNAEWGRRLAIGVLSRQSRWRLAQCFAPPRPAHPDRSADRRVNDFVSVRRSARKALTRYCSTAEDHVWTISSHFALLLTPEPSSSRAG